MAGRKTGTPKTGGRLKGTPNKVTALAKDAIAAAVERLGGIDRLVEWVRADPGNERVFWGTIYTKLLPLQVSQCTPYFKDHCRMAAEQRITLPYAPRRIFLPYHNRSQRWACIVAHRRCGKMVACINDMIKRALLIERPHGRFAFVAPFLAQAKEVAWEYLKRYAAPVIADKMSGK